MTIEKVVLVGANGKLGPSILHALQSASIKVTVLVRQSSKTQYPPNITTATVPDSLPHSELVTLLQGHDALVIAFSGTQTSNSIKLANAALEAGTIRRIIPADYGSCDSSDPRSLDLVPLYKQKLAVRDHLIKLSKESNGKLTWTSLITGHFLDYGLKSGLLNFNLTKKKATIFDGGDIKWSATTLDGIALAVVKVLQNEERTRDKLLYVQGLCATQNELLRTVQEVMDVRFEVEHVRSEDFIAKYKGILEEKGGNDADATEELVSVEGTVNAYWGDREGFANELLGLPEENLRDVVRKVVESL